ncbi:MAG TPA: hypothetical protein VMH26_01105 [Burkholderiales bacterium]|nr:hypothetical protein [Burkholderiales bacterium]
MKWFHLGAVSGGAFGEYRYALAARQGLHDVPVGTPRVLPLRAFDEDRSSARHQKPEHGPAADVRLRHEAHRNHRVDNPHVEPRYVIAHDQGRRVTRGQRAAHRQPQMHDAQNLSRPALDRCEAPLAGKKGEQDAYAIAAVDQMQQEPGQPIQPDEG